MLAPGLLGANRLPARLRQAPLVGDRPKSGSANKSYEACRRLADGPGDALQTRDTTAGYKRSSPSFKQNWGAPAWKQAVGTPANISFRRRNSLQTRANLLFWPLGSTVPRAPRAPARTSQSVMHTNSKLLFQKYAIACFQPGMKVLEIGPDTFPSSYQKLAAQDGMRWDTLDLYDSPSLTYPKSPLYSFPVPDCAYDIVLSGQVIEHVAKIWKWMPELARVVKPGGRVITINPASWPYHDAPIDCWRIYPKGMEALSEEAGLKVETSYWGTLELPQFFRALPGRSPEDQPRHVRMVFRLLGTLRFPVEKSFDTITIARKPA
jgi:SAM-dependent methyltransferase